MRIITKEALQGYQTILKLPSYLVMEHPETFHTVVVYRKRTPNQTDRLRVMGETTAPGLASDPPITVPAGMLREIVKKVGGLQREDLRYEEPVPARTAGNVRIPAEVGLSDRISRLVASVDASPYPYTSPTWGNIMGGNITDPPPDTTLRLTEEEEE